MNLYLTDAHIPELVGFSSTQWRIIRRGALNVLRREHPFARCWVGLLGGIGWAAGCLLGTGLSHLVSTDGRLLVMCSVGAIFGGIGGFIGEYRFTLRLRPYFSRFIQEHRDVILRAA
jgi:hypothetical protein